MSTDIVPKPLNLKGTTIAYPVVNHASHPDPKMRLLVTMNTLEMDIETVGDNYNKSNRCESIKKTIQSHHKSLTQHRKSSISNKKSNTNSNHHSEQFSPNNNHHDHSCIKLNADTIFAFTSSVISPP
eukprot:996342_1